MPDLLDQNVNGKELSVTVGGEVAGFAFSPDSLWLVSSHRDGSLLTWNLGSAAPDSSSLIRPSHRYWGAMNTTSFAFEGRDSILTMDRFATVRRWPISASEFPDTWTKLEPSIRRVIGRNLSRQEWRDHFEGWERRRIIGEASPTCPKPPRRVPMSILKSLPRQESPGVIGSAGTQRESPNGKRGSA